MTTMKHHALLAGKA
ncbi:hypothetical protein M0802_015689 [Mischocyttarus mexicanus]|nr:hypothetical protein M0802_015716 [Mischocyttarus mexicanus]KAI4474280.1 hypothetical protein M0802_015689 [Mischocyttarus mexicanus]